jgi:hypothetical protein
MIEKSVGRSINLSSKLMTIEQCETVTVFVECFLLLSYERLYPFTIIVRNSKEINLCLCLPVLKRMDQETIRNRRRCRNSKKVRF